MAENKSITHLTFRRTEMPTGTLSSYNHRCYNECYYIAIFSQ